MRKDRKPAPPRGRKQRANKAWVLCCLPFVILFCCSMCGFFLEYRKALSERDAFIRLSESLSEPSYKGQADAQGIDFPANQDETGSFPVQAASKPDAFEILPKFSDLHEQNPELFGWIRIEGTRVDYPVMHSPDRPEFYLRHAFDGTVSKSGVPFLDSGCSPNGNCFLVYGHHMKSGAMFGQLVQYADEAFYEAHPVIRFDTLYEHRIYRVAAAFYSRVYGEQESGVFRYYDCLDLSDPEDFDEYACQLRRAALYDTGISMEYGDDLLILSTCSYHTDNGRFVVAAVRHGK